MELANLKLKDVANNDELIEKLLGKDNEDMLFKEIYKDISCSCCVLASHSCIVLGKQHA